ncbi:MAG: DUF1934 domain-containing protein [Saccharofermentanales bacterium]|jgi:uncharacterized beta-barrel protein YwiB (DUF1934 family)|nr:DUF1934 domain-containing protein [Clostridiaceae bacterium]
MEPNVLLTIEGQQWSQNDQPQAVRLTTEGRLFREELAWYIVYHESQATGMEGTLTTMRVADDGTVSLIRTGSHDMRLTFKAGDRHITRMETPYGDLDVEIYTSLVQSTITEAGGSIHLGYTIDLNKREHMNTRLDVEIKRRH